MKGIIWTFCEGRLVCECPNTECNHINEEYDWEEGKTTCPKCGQEYSVEEEVERFYILKPVFDEEKGEEWFDEFDVEKPFFPQFYWSQGAKFSNAAFGATDPNCPYCEEFLNLEEDNPGEYEHTCKGCGKTFKFKCYEFITYGVD